MMRGTRTPCFNGLFVVARIGNDAVVLTEIAVGQVCFANLGTSCRRYPLPWIPCLDIPRMYFFMLFVKTRLTVAAKSTALSETAWLALPPSLPAVDLGM